MNPHISRYAFPAAIMAAALVMSAPCFAGPFGFFSHKSGSASSQAVTSANVTTEHYGGRSLLVYVPSQLPPAGSRALVVVLHGGMGNAQRIENAQSESGLKLDAVAEKNGFIVAYLNGTPVTKHLGADRLGWNAGGCCGQSAENKIDDVGYIKGAVDYLAHQYGIDRSRVYGTGHSNGAMMTARLVCETNLYAAVVTFSGSLNVDTQTCPGARGKRILSVHGSDDENVPIQGGKGSKGLSGADFKSEEFARQIFTNSGADFHLQVVPGADHKLDHIADKIQQAEGLTLPEKIARFFGLAH
jgi:poly(3-hydroxybutyrate) depolymerase